ncbi:P27 family predicted phage terminase small subunit [Nocardia transvalensis]|uniref:P27 family predicted phage terminase small subunit n=2 Tax=Nocardia transvalensis TaxID=37333 RepID=A0A7W9PFY3_9NOCA|nr:phage terminase small subunit P27 family [Nocardia transvalensis]MBB5915291.1 P27 family predicted phage terminase small subunit [Nocardia transvalensis]
MGRTAAPAALRLLGGRADGRDSGGRVVEPTPAFRRIPPNPPTWLSREARAEWRRIVPGLARLDLLKEEDRALLAVYCETWARFVQATRDVQYNGFTIVNRTLRKDGTESEWTAKNPAVTVAENAAAQLRGLAQEFGLTPSAESKLARTPDGGGNHDNPFE